MRKLMACLVALTATAAANASVIDSASYNGHTYYLLSTNTWTGSEAEAVSLGGHLVTINDAAENAFLVNQWASGPNARSLWIGLNDAAVEGTFVWSSGQPVTYTNWNGGEPNNLGNEDYAHLMTLAFAGGRWNDLVNTDASYNGPKFGVVEVVPEPISLVVFGGLLVGGAGVALRRRMAKAAA